MEHAFLMPVLVVILVGGVMLMLFMRGAQARKDADLFIRAKSRMKVHKNFYGEFLEGRVSLGLGQEFHLIRRAAGVVICRHSSSGKMFIISGHTYLEALQEGRIKEFHRP
jgi:hypothetical protein